MAFWLCFASTVCAAAADDDAVWFDDLEEPPQLSASDRLAIGQAVWSAVRGQGIDVGQLPAEWRDDSAARIVFVSISDSARRAAVGVGSGRGLAAAVRLATDRARRGMAADRPVLWVRLDVVDDVLTQPSIAATTGLPWSRNVTGLATDRRVGMALLPEELTAYWLVEGDGQVNRLAVAQYLLRHASRGRLPGNLRPWHSGKIYRFTTVGVFCDETGVVPLVRGRRSVGLGGRSEFEAAARLGGQYLARCVEDDGQFVYFYRPRNNGVLPRYNILRHAGATYAMLEVHERTQDKATLDAANRALDYLASTVGTVNVGEDRLQWVVEGGYAKLGGNALAVLAMTKHATVTGDRRHLPLAQQLASSIVAVQGPNGRFRVHKIRQRDGWVSPFVSGYYPGEAVFALVRLYELDRDERWLDAAAKSAAYLVNVRDAGLPIKKLTHDHWLLYGLDALHRHRPDAQYVAQTLRIVEAIGASQHRSEPADDWQGGYYEPPTATASSTRTEGLAAACRLLRDFATDEQADNAMNIARLGATFVLRSQLWPESAMFFPRPQRCVGGVQMSLTDTDVQIDFVQHAISCWLETAMIVPDDEQ